VQGVQLVTALVFREGIKGIVMRVNLMLVVHLVHLVIRILTLINPQCQATTTTTTRLGPQNHPLHSSPQARPKSGSTPYMRMVHPLMVGLQQAGRGPGTILLQSGRGWRSTAAVAGVLVGARQLVVVVHLLALEGQVVQLQSGHVRRCWRHRCVMRVIGAGGARVCSCSRCALFGKITAEALLQQSTVLAGNLAQVL
jgi:hypothetical protein